MVEGSSRRSYTRQAQIGEGTYGEVYVGTCLATSEKVALKKIRMDNEKEGFPITAIREIKLLKMLDHDNVITLKEIVRSQAHTANNMKGSIYMVFDYMDHDLTGLMERRNYKMEVPHIKCYMKQLLKGLQFCHAKKILHRDLKASNLLINNEGVLKIADFGLARTKDEMSQKVRLTNRVITLWYRPPELILGANEYGPEIDIWSVGCIFAELLTGQPLFPGKDETDQLDKISKIMGSPSEQTMPGFSKLLHHGMVESRYKENRLLKHLQSKKITDPHALKLLSKLLEMDPKKRITAEQAVLDDYFFTDPQPARPQDLPKYAASHELDMKKLRQEAKSKHAGGAHGVAPAAKRPRHGAEPTSRSHDAAHSAAYGNRAPLPQRQGPGGYRTDDGRGGYGEGGPIGPGRAYDSRFPGHRPVPAVPTGTYPGGPIAYPAGHPGFGNYPGGTYAQAAMPGYDHAGYPLRNYPTSQAHKGQGPPQQELGAQPSWMSNKR